MLVQITHGKVAYISEMEDGRQRHLVADTDITAGTWHNVTLIVSGQKHVCLTVTSYLLAKVGSLFLQPSSRLQDVKRHLFL